MTSNPPSRCCMVGHLHEGEAKGEIRQIANISTYVSYPSNQSSENAILFLTDAMGHRFINAQLIADQFAANGYLVVMPELFHGDPIPINYGADFDIWGWYKKHLPPRVDPIVEAVLEEMHTTLGCQRIGGVGYCFGGKYVCRYLKAGKLDAGFIAHPTMVEVDEVKGIEGPLSIAAAIIDPVFTTAKRHESEEILARLDIPFQINLFSDVEHGFAVRCDLSEPRQKFAKEKAFEQAVAWFDEYVKV
ncbi:dienelactone hydrolase family protein [Aspergillus sclerotiicarbonarius CBS 121057]|uniref:Dienelactone hydrolase family protein n=1 Tax=Aspergillus sclerotiicarbonarius (strain CBS 121057 / IBT 28362) TaxID=1448318 RepID=A0A319EC97_ASPSB|nr:dienelactone hydrolase family protein [Aspergillus sclerotiicarbonarius CBS 121057]